MNGKLINRDVLSVDVRRYTSRAARRQIDIQSAVDILADQATVHAGLDPELWAKQPTGDGFIAVTEADVDTVRLVGRFPDELNRVLTVYNLDRVPEAQIDLRLAIHHGTVVALKSGGYTGEAFNEVSRLLNAQPARTALDHAAPAHLAVIVSEPVFSVVRTSFDGLSEEPFVKVQATIAEKGFRRTAYVRVPGMAGDVLRELLTGSGEDSENDEGEPGDDSQPSSADGPTRAPSPTTVRNSTRIKGHGNQVVNAGRDVSGSGR